MPSSVCKLHLSHIRRAVVYPPREFRAVLTDRPRHYKSGASLDRPPRSAPPAARSPPRSAPPAARSQPRPSSRLESAYFLIWAVFSATSEIRYEHPRGHPRKCVRPRPRNFRAAFPEKFPKKFSRFVFAFRFRVSFSRFVFSASRNLRYEHPHGSQRTCLARVLLA